MGDNFDDEFEKLMGFSRPGNILSEIHKLMYITGRNVKEMMFKKALSETKVDDKIQNLVEIPHKIKEM